MKAISSGLLVALAVFAFPELGSAQGPSQTAGSTSLRPTNSAASAPAVVKPVQVSAIAGTWAGQVQQAGRDRPFAIIVSIDAKVATTTYPEQGCAGVLTRIGSSGWWQP